MKDDLRYQYRSVGESVFRRPIPGDDGAQWVGTFRNPFLANKAAYLLNTNVL